MSCQENVIAVCTRQFLRRVSVYQDGQYDVPKPFHFSPPELHHMITVIYPESFSDSKLGKPVCDTFLLHDAMQAWPMSSCGVCPSVCMYVCISRS